MSEISPPPAAHPHLGGNIRFCVSCGSELVYRAWTEGDDSMQLCCDGPKCKHVHFLDPKVAAGVIPSIDGKAIILKRAYNPGKGLWTFPGGFVNRGEVVSEAAARETKEEAGVDVRVGPLLGVYSFPGNPTILIVYAGEVTGGEPRALDESTELRLVGPDEIPFDDLAFDTTRAAFRDWRSWIGEKLPGA
ncbi:MAG: NUDIX domain-containing protein [Nitrospinota bacterium]|jgi:ADP-ribose pyrophosphatase YjhB (NUDIX family)|nr:NUDIX domain-containing protein [Nitrospinota bacterium]MDP6366439.1 NUDIX domain-containing protein [Nitrospinota bacterium]MDP7168655.1 NUDIX domain-containing protein [Nitrospinota bacterium]MDP7371281.1 NUDIX domain-containing protein [Nitrospinota bacterium]MDP7503127.1 NUDIX domain-containing protein [Nitrospinota bacterium]|tara:strand:+ start:2715 stop:3284 length:570 start_codon:yes stop_codon:yes gene_type:complete